MPRADHRAVERNDTITDVFASLMGEDSRFVSWNRKVEDIRVDGVRLGDLRAALRRSAQPQVTEAYHSVVMTADALVGLGYDGASAEIVRRPENEPPDLELVLDAERRTVYAEFSRVCHQPDERIGSLTNEVDAVLKQLVDSEGAFASTVKARSLHITFRMRPSQVPGAADLVDDIKRFALASDPNKPTFAPYAAFGPAYPALHAFGATYWRSDIGWTGGNFVQYEVADLGLPALLAAIQERIDAKDEKAYPQRPLWLVMPVSETWRESVRPFFDGVENGSITVDTKRFDAVVVAVTGYAIAIPPIVRATATAAADSKSAAAEVTPS
jgi:hypothetical protein